MDHLNSSESALYKQFESISVLGVNETSSTYLVRHKGTDELYVKKLVSNEQVMIYQQLKEINSPYLPNVFAVYEFEHYSIIIEEFIKGESLKQKLEREQVIEEYEAVSYMYHLCVILQLLHQHRIIHRDINPANIMISEEGIVKLIDFGISRVFKNIQNQDTTIMGTVGFTAPEQFGFTQTDQRSDIYSLGVLFNIMLTGKYPNEYMIENILYRNIVMSCIFIDPDARYGKIEELIKDIGQLSARFSKQKRLIVRKIPGFRTGKLYKKIVAIIGYLVLLLLTFISFFDEVESIRERIEMILLMVLFFYVPLLLLTNIFYFDRRVPVFKSKSRGVALVFRIFLCFISFIILGIVLMFTR